MCRVVRNTRNPVYDEDFTFYGLSFAELSGISLHFVVLSFDRYSRDDIIGEVICPLSNLDLNQIESQQVALSKEIQPRSLKVCHFHLTFSLFIAPQKYYTKINEILYRLCLIELDSCTGTW